MTVYPGQIDTDIELPKVDDDITEIGGLAIDALRDAVFAIEETLGINPQGTAGDIASRLDTSLEPDGTIKASALTTLGLLTNIIDSQVAAGAGIQESKLDLDHSTASLSNRVDLLDMTLTALNTFAVNVLAADFVLHLGGLTPLNLGINGRHVASHTDLNDGYNGALPYAYGIDPRDPAAFFNTGLINESGGFRTSKNVMAALLDINNALLAHENISISAHAASAISVLTSGFTTIPSTATDVQTVLSFIDVMATTVYEEHRATMHSNGVTRTASSEDLVADGYVEIVQTLIPCVTTLNGTVNDLVEITTTSLTQFELDKLFRTIGVGDYINISYDGYNVQAQYTINSIRFYPSSRWMLTIDGVNLANTTLGTPAHCSFEKKKFDDNTFGNLAVAPSNHDLWTVYPSVPGSLIVVNPRAAQATGLDCHLDELDPTHYFLYLAFYPIGTVDEIIILPPIDVTGNLGITPGLYTLDDVIRNVNDGFRASGYNYRMVAFEKDGQFGLSIADTYGNPGFSIISGIINGAGALVAGGYTNNVIGNDRTNDYQDALGLGSNKANVASPQYVAPTGVPGSVPTKVFVGRKNRNFNVDGKYQDFIAGDPTTNSDGYWPATLINRTATVNSVEVTYRVDQDLSTSRLRVGSTIVVQPVLLWTAPTFLEQDYGRFVVKEISYNGCPVDTTTITVMNGIYATGNAIDVSSGGPLSVSIYFGCDSVVLNPMNVIDDVMPTAKKRHFEIFMSKKGTTEAYERARFAVSAAAGEIDTSFGATTAGTNLGWHIMEVSPKFQGYVEVAGLHDTRFYVNFVISDYNAVEKSYDGHLVQVDATLLTPFEGPKTRVRKGEIGRYYDATGVDYIDIMFNEPSNPPDHDILGPLSTDERFKTIEIFPSERTNNEFMCLGNCEMLQLAHGGNVVGYVTDLREFGTVSEKTLSTSAIDFITAGDRHLHENGVINDFDFITNDGAFNLFFNGGMALVNGYIIAKNDLILTPLPFVAAGSASSTVNMAICINDDGNIDYILIDSASGLLEVKNDALTTRYERVYTFAELIDSRKDLLPLWLLTVTSQIVGDTISISAMSSPVDVRRFVSCGNINQIFVTGSERLDHESETRFSKRQGHFSSLQAAVSYVSNMVEHANTIHVKGTIYIDDPITLPAGITIIGEKKNRVICRDTQSLFLSSDTTIRGLNFDRQFTVGVGAEPYSPNGLGSGTLIAEMATGSYTLENITIEDCSFTTTDTRASSVPHILFEQVGDGGKFKNIIVRNNRFLEVLAQLDIAFVNRGGTSLAVLPATPAGTMLINVLVDNNVGNQTSYMMFSSDNGTFGTERSSRGLSAYGLKITNNQLDYIWLNVSRFVFHGFDNTTDALYSTSQPALHPEVIVEGNAFTGLISRTIAGRLFTTFAMPIAATPSAIVSENKCSQIYINSCMDTHRNDKDINYPGELMISDNIISSSMFDSALFNPSDNPVNLGTDVYGILVSANGLATQTGAVNFNVTINNNIITNPYDGLETMNVYYYDSSIYSNIPAKITNNIVKKCIKTNGDAIVCDLHWFTLVPDNTLTASICDNWIERGSTSINSYIRIYGDTKIKEVQIVDNLFDYYTVDGGTNTATIAYTAAFAYKINAQKNINRLFTIDLMPYVNEMWHPVTTSISWKKSLYILSPLYIKELSTSIDQSWVGNSSYPVDYFVINMPFVDGAKPYQISFKIGVSDPTDLAGTTIQIYVFSPTSTSLANYSFIQPNPIVTEPPYIVTNVTDSIPDSFTVGAGPGTTTKDFTIDVSGLSARYTNIPSHDRTVPIYVVLANTAGMIKTFLKKTGAATFEQIHIYNLKGQFIG